MRRNARYAALLVMAAFTAAAFSREAFASRTLQSCPGATRADSIDASTGAIAAKSLSLKPRELIVIGFMGGHIKGDDFVHREAGLARKLRQLYPTQLHAEIFANRDSHAALQQVLELLDKEGDGNGCLSAQEKEAARIVLFGHSWGASETVAFARRLNSLGIPVLLTIQVDSVQKAGEDDGHIPPNVREAVNFYQTDGLLHGRSRIEAADPARTTILGNFASTYRDHPVSCSGYPWYAQAFMRPHIEIENDPRVWDKIEALIQTRLQ